MHKKKKKRHTKLTDTVWDLKKKKMFRQGLRNERKEGKGEGIE